jgi:hypothetical protein
MSSKIEVAIKFLEGCANNFERCGDIESVERAREIRAILAAPAVERQPSHWLLVNPKTGGGSYYPYRPEECISREYKVTELFTAPPELAELQAIIAQQAAEIERLKGGQGGAVGAVENGRIFADRVEQLYAFKDEYGHPLTNCADWQELRKCFDYLAEFASPPEPVAVPAKYDYDLLPFVALMRKELHANAVKGDRAGWLEMSTDTALLEIIYHFGKLQASVKRGDEDGIREYAADVANMCMMLVDICACLDKVKELNQ